MILPIVSGVFSLAQTWLDSKVKVSEATAAARAEIIKKSIDNEAAWENIQAQNSDRSWKDEWWTIILSLPLIMSFVPSWQPYVILGFEALEKVPDWYKYSVGIAISSSFGLRAIAKWVNK